MPSLLKIAALSVLNHTWSNAKLYGYRLQSIIITINKTCCSCCCLSVGTTKFNWPSWKYRQGVGVGRRWRGVSHNDCHASLEIGLHFPDICRSIFKKNCDCNIWVHTPLPEIKLKILMIEFSHLHQTRHLRIILSYVIYYREGDRTI